MKCEYIKFYVLLEDYNKAIPDCFCHCSIVMKELYNQGNSPKRKYLIEALFTHSEP